MAKKPQRQQKERLFEEKLVPAKPGSNKLFEVSYGSDQPVECLGKKFENDEARWAYFLEKLREKLKDPKFRKIEGFPIGEDEDILALSDPPYYTACPNPFIGAFVRLHGKPYDPSEDSYHREPFAADVSEGRSGTIYDAHTYHTKVPHKAIMQYILHYTDPGAIVLDAFGGTGMTAIAADLCNNAASELDDFEGTAGRRFAIASDLGPAATQIAAGYCARVGADVFSSAATDLLSSADKDIGWVYRTRDDKGKPETLIYAIWSDVLGCADCGSEIVFWDAAYDPTKVEIKDTFLCPACNAHNTKRTTHASPKQCLIHSWARR